MWKAGTRAVHRLGSEAAETIEQMRVAGQIAAQARAVGPPVAPGVTTDEIDRVGHEFLCDHGAYPSTLGYRRFPKSLCTCVNEVICHGIPDAARSRTATSSTSTSPPTSAVCTATPTRRTSRRGRGGPVARRAHPGGATPRNQGGPAGRQVNVIGRVIESYARRFGYGVVRSSPATASARRSAGADHPIRDPRFDNVMMPGMTFTIEPMLTLGTAEWDMWDEGWTVATKDRRNSAQFEHTLLVTDDGAEVLTLP